MSFVNNNSLSVVPYRGQSQVTDQSRSYVQKNLKGRMQSVMDSFSTYMRSLEENRYLSTYKSLHLGGKGIIDIAIAVNKNDMESTSKQLQTLGYEVRPTFSTPDRFYFIIYLPDPEEENRRYHIHSTYPENNEWKEFIGFRDYLINHPQELQEYAELKKQAALEANHEGERYRKIKEPIFKKISELISKTK